MTKRKAVPISAFTLLLIILLAAFVYLWQNKGGSPSTGGNSDTPDGLEYTLLEDGTYAISVGRALYSDEIIIPSMHEGKPVTAIAENGFANLEKLQSIHIPSSIKRIGKDAFKNTEELEDVHIFNINAWCDIDFSNSYSNPLRYARTFYVAGMKVENLAIPSGQKTVKPYAFYGCTALKSVVIPDSVTRMEDYAFAECTELSEVILGESVTFIGQHTFDGIYSKICNVNAGIYYLGNSTNPHFALVKAQLKNAESFYSHADTRVVASGAFEGCELLNKVTLTANIRFIGSYAFLGCRSLSRVNFPDLASWCKIDFDGYYANPLSLAGEFYLGEQNNEKLVSSLEFSDEIKSIGAYAFYNCRGLESVSFSEDVTYIGPYAFAYCTSLKRINIPNGIEKINPHTFDHCTSLDSVDFGQGVRAIEEYAFDYCIGLTEISLTGAVERVGTAAFSRCEAVRTLRLGDGVKEIGNEAFLGCSKLNKILTPESLEKIGERAFAKCFKLTSVTVPKNVSSIGADAFFECYKLIEVINHSSLHVEKGNVANGCVAMYARTVHSEGTRLFEIDGYLFYSGEGENYLLAYNGTDTELSLPQSCKSEDYKIYSYAFADSSRIKSVNIPDSVVSVGEYAFYNCSDIRSVKLGNRILNIGAFAFSKCPSLGEVILNGTLEVVEEGAFAYCTALKRVEIGDSVTKIGEAAFFKCQSLDYVEIGLGVESIGRSAFEDCRDIESVNIKSVFNWCRIDFDNNFSNPLGYAKYLYINGERTLYVNIPDGITKIRAYAFYGFDGIMSVTLPESLTEIGNSAFYGCSRLCEVINSSSLEIKPGSADYGSVAELALSVHSGDTGIRVEDDLIFIVSGDEAHLVAYVGLGSVLSLPQTIDGLRYRIGSFAFAESSVTEIIIPEGVTEIGMYAFFNTGLVSVVIPDSVTNIKENAFSLCEQLKSVSLGNGVVKISAWAFSGCIELNAVTMGTSLTEIRTGAFYGCESLFAISIPKSVTFIGNFAFVGCKSLSNVYFADPSDWKWCTNFSEGYNSYEISQSMLSNSDKASNMLLGSYSEYFLFKEKEANSDV